jgi:hypothetical protein
MANWQTKAAVAIASGSMLLAAPASATIFEYTFNNGDVLSIDTETQVGTWTGDNINATFTSKDFATFTGGESPSFMTTLASIDGTRTINGNTVGLQSDPRHPEMLKTASNNRWNLWATWGDPVVGGDYVRKIASYSVADVPAPGMLALFGMALAALGLRSRKRKQAA